MAWLKLKNLRSAEFSHQSWGEVTDSRGRQYSILCQDSHLNKEQADQLDVTILDQIGDRFLVAIPSGEHSGAYRFENGRVVEDARRTLTVNKGYIEIAA